MKRDLVGPYMMTALRVLEALNMESHTLTLNAPTLGDVMDVGYKESVSGLSCQAPCLMVVEFLREVVITGRI